MSTTTLNCSGGTYLSPVNPTADYSSASYLYTSYKFSVDSRESLEDKASRGVDAPCAILRFTKSNALKYKKINRVTLHFEITLEGYVSGSFSYPYAMAPYKSNGALSNINFNSYESAGELGNWIRSSGVINTGTTSFNIDITSLFSSNIQNDEFNIAIAFLPFYYSTAVSTYKAKIQKSTSYLTVEYETVAQLAPTPLYPKDTTLLETQSLLFSWQFNAETEAVQSAVILEYKKNTDVNYTVLNLSTTDHSYTVNANFTPGTYQWRMKATNDISETSAYSEIVTFNIIGKPAAPVIATPPNKTLTTISWTAAEQLSCEIKLIDADQSILIHDTLATAQMSYKPNMFLKGNYTFLVRIKNASDIWSDWAQVAFAITASGPSAASMTAIPENDHVRLEFAIPSDTSAAVIRYESGDNMKVLATLSQTDVMFIDDTVCPDTEYEYAIRTFVNGYTDSTLRHVSVNWAGAIIKAGDEKLHLYVSDAQFNPHNEEIAREMAVINYSGRELPLVERGEFTSVSVTKKFYIPLNDKKVLDRFSKANSIHYRDSRGNTFKAAITGISYTEFMDDGYVATINMIKTAEDEVIMNV